VNALIVGSPVEITEIILTSNRLIGFHRNANKLSLLPQTLPRRHSWLFRGRKSSSKSTQL